jgi:putative addiction module killer protein
METYEIRHYLDGNGNDLYQDWVEHVRDRTAQVAIIRRVARMAVGQFGDHKHLQEGVWELRIDVGAGYRVYYAHVGGRVVLLTHGGDKGSQSRDIARAVKLLKDWERKNET